MSRSYRIVALCLPLLAIGLGIVRAELFMDRAREFVFDIEGFDPRDLLRGHYLQFRVRAEPASVREPCDEGNESCCLCLTRREPDEPPFAQRTTCDTARAHCDGALYVRYVSEPQRYYVPEDQAPELERKLLDAMQKRRAQVVLAIDAQGEARVRQLRLDGEAIPGAVGR